MESLVDGITLGACPFCKSDPLALNQGGELWTRCSNEDCQADSYMSLDAWNTRPIEDELRAEIERLRAELAAAQMEIERLQARIKRLEDAKERAGIPADCVCDPTGWIGYDNKIVVDPICDHYTEDSYHPGSCGECYHDKACHEHSA